MRRLAVVAGGDGFGRAVRAAVAARWRKQGGQLTHEESVSLDGSDLRSRLRAATRSGPEAIVLGFEGAALGQAARALREAGHTGLILAVDDDRAAILAAGRALDGALLLSDAFVPVPGTRGALFARAYEARHSQPPSRFAANAYDVAILLFEAAERSVASGRGLTASRLREVLSTGGPFPSLYAGDLVLRDDGTLGRPLALFRVDGERAAFEGYVGLDGRVLPKPAGATP
jgi:ABC-type branched-subunit amino acid transport system substrate-binding protein